MNEISSDSLQLGSEEFYSTQKRQCYPFHYDHTTDLTGGRDSSVTYLCIYLSVYLSIHCCMHSKSGLKMLLVFFFLITHNSLFFFIASPHQVFCSSNAGWIYARFSVALTGAARKPLAIVGDSKLDSKLAQQPSRWLSYKPRGPKKGKFRVTPHNTEGDKSIDDRLYRVRYSLYIT